MGYEGTGHPSDEDFVRFAENRCLPYEAERIQVHLDHCAECSSAGSLAVVVEEPES